MDISRARVYIQPEIPEIPAEDGSTPCTVNYTNGGMLVHAMYLNMQYIPL